MFICDLDSFCTIWKVCAVCQGKWDKSRSSRMTGMWQPGYKKLLVELSSQGNRHPAGAPQNWEWLGEGMASHCLFKQKTYTEPNEKASFKEFQTVWEKLWRNRRMWLFFKQVTALWSSLPTDVANPMHYHGMERRTEKLWMRKRGLLNIKKFLSDKEVPEAEWLETGKITWETAF